jgi:hypothetical protein
MDRVFVVNESVNSCCGAPSRLGCQCGKHNAGAKPKANYAGQAVHNSEQPEPMNLKRAAAPIWDFSSARSAERSRGASAEAESQTVANSDEREAVPVGMGLNQPWTF